MFAFVNNKLTAASYFRADIVSAPGKICQGRQTIALGDSVGKGLQSVYILGGLTAELVEELLLQFERLFLGIEGLGFVFLELFGNVALGVLDCLLADVVGGDLIGRRVIYFDIVAEDLIVSDFKIADAGALGLFLLIIPQPALAVF